MGYFKKPCFRIYFLSRLGICKGMRMLAAPVKGDPSVTSGESGAVGMGVISSIMTDDAYKELREALELDNSSQVLMFSTEGDTDPDKYKKIVWGGEYPTV